MSSPFPSRLRPLGVSRESGPPPRARPAALGKDGRSGWTRAGPGPPIVSVRLEEDPRVPDGTCGSRSMGTSSIVLRFRCTQKAKPVPGETGGRGGRESTRTPRKKAWKYGGLPMQGLALGGATRPALLALFRSPVGEGRFPAVKKILTGDIFLPSLPPCQCLEGKLEGAVRGRSPTEPGPQEDPRTKTERRRAVPMAQQ